MSRLIVFMTYVTEKLSRINIPDDLLDMSIEIFSKPEPLFGINELNASSKSFSFKVEVPIKVPELFHSFEPSEPISIAASCGASLWKVILISCSMGVWVLAEPEI